MLTIAHVHDALRSGTISSTDLTRRTLHAVDAVNDRCGAFLDRYDDSALAAATAADRVLGVNTDVGRVWGVPVGVKDLISTAEGPTTAQSLVHDPTSITGDGFAMARLRAAGMVVVGKTTTQEFGVGRHDPGKAFPVPRNPWDPEHCTGGSSTGSAGAVAGGALAAALGTDSGGSVRIPSAFCGVTGLKPTFGRVSRSGTVPLGFSLDHVGPIARSAHDCALLLGVLAGNDPADLSSVDRPVPWYEGALTGDVSGLRIGVSRRPLDHPAVDPDLSAMLDDAVDTLVDLGARPTEIELPFEDQLRDVYAITAVGEALAYHAPDLEHRWSDYFAATRTTIAAGAYYTASDYVQAQRVRQAALRAVTTMFLDVDIIVTPTTSIAAPSIDDLEHYYGPEGQRAVHTQYWNLMGNPAMSVPMGLNRANLPLGLQIIGRPFDEASVLRVGDAYQRATDWHLRLSPIAQATGIAFESDGVCVW